MTSKPSAVAGSRKKSPKQPQPFISYKAEPLSDDDFEQDAKREAKLYNRLQDNEAEREKVRKENILRRKRGEAPERLPKKETMRALERQDKRKNKRRGVDDSDESDVDLLYEGQVKLTFNPLYMLAGLDQPGDTRNHVEAAKRQLVAHLASSSANPAPPTLPDLSDETEPGDTSQGTLFETLEPDVAGEADVNFAEEEEEVEAEEEEEGTEADEDYELEHELLVVPGFTQLPPSEPVLPLPRMTALDAEPDDGMEEAEETNYDDDDWLFGESVHELWDLLAAQPPVPSTLTATPLAPGVSVSLDSDQSARPPFAPSEAQRLLGPLHLDEHDPSVIVPASINRFLREYQRVGARFFYEKYQASTGGVLGDDMGLGKTIQVIAFLSAIMRKSGTAADLDRRKRLIRSTGALIAPQRWPTALIVCPKSLVRNWERELDLWGYFEWKTIDGETAFDVMKDFTDGRLDLMIGSYDMVTRLANDIKDMPISVVIADEAHVLKEPMAKKTLALKSLQCRARFALTGTLIQNRLDETWSVLDFVHRGWAGTLKQWRAFAVNPIKKGHKHDGTVEQVTVAIWRLGLLHQKVLPHFYLRRDKRLIAHELPRKRDMIILCDLGARQVDAYTRLVNSPDVAFITRRGELCDCDSGEQRCKCHHEVNDDGETVTEAILKHMTACRKVANHFGLLYHAKDDSPHTMEVNKRIFKICTGTDYDAKEGNLVQASLDPANCGKWAPLEELLLQWRSDRAANNKVLVFSSSVRLLKMIQEFILMSETLGGFEHELLSGEVDGKRRMEMVDRFQDTQLDHFLLLVSTQAGGVGFNLTAANKVVIFDPAWSEPSARDKLTADPANDLQAMDRAFRIGQKRAVDVFRLIGKGTLEELVYERQIHKQQRARQLNDGTYERRIHHGYDRAPPGADQGELFGALNIFRFDPKGFMRDHRARTVEDQFIQDQIEADYAESANEDLLEDDDAAKTLSERRQRELARAGLDAQRKRDDESVLKQVLGGDEEAKVMLKHCQELSEGELLSRLGITPHMHDSAFSDSKEERDIYLLGKQMLLDNPELAKSLKANDVGTVRLKQRAAGGGGGGPAKRARRASEQRGGPGEHGDSGDDEPWRERIARPRRAGKRLALLSDDDE